MDNAALRALLIAPDGPVGEDMRRRAQRALAAQEVSVAVDTGVLLESLGIEEVPSARGLSLKIGSADVDYSHVVEDGDPTNPDYPRQPFLRPSLRAAADGPVIGTVRGTR